MIIKKIHAAEAYRNEAKLNYIHPLWFYQKPSKDLSKGETREIHGKKLSRSLVEHSSVVQTKEILASQLRE